MSSKVEGVFLVDCCKSKSSYQIRGDIGVADHPSVNKEYIEWQQAEVVVAKLEREIREAKKNKDKAKAKKLDNDLRVAKKARDKEKKEYFDAVHAAVKEETIGQMVGGRIKGLPGAVSSGTLSAIKNQLSRFNPNKYRNRQPSVADIKKEADAYTGRAKVLEEEYRYRKSGRNKHGIQYGAREGCRCNLGAGVRHSAGCPYEFELFTDKDRE